MKLHRYITFVLSFILILTFTACRQEDQKTAETPLLPFNLQFGQSYDEFSETIKANYFETTISPAKANNGYVTDHIYLTSIAAESYLDYEVFHTSSNNTLEDADKGSFYFSFNQDKELYEWYWFNEAVTRDAEEVVNSMIETYNKYFGFDGKTDDPSLPAVWETEKLAADIQKTESNGKDIIVFTVHSFEYDLDSK